MLKKVQETIDNHFSYDPSNLLTAKPKPTPAHPRRVIANASGLRYFRCVFCSHQWASKFKRKDSTKDAKRPDRCPQCRCENNPYKTDVVAKERLTLPMRSR